MLSTLHWHPMHPNTYPKPRYMQYFVCEPLHCPCESFLVQSTVRHSLVHFTTEVKYFTPLRLASVEWKPVCKVCLTCQPPSIGTQGTPIYATNPSLWKNLSVGPLMATIIYSLLLTMRKIRNSNCILWLKTSLYGLSDMLATQHWHPRDPYIGHNPKYMK